MSLFKKKIQRSREQELLYCQIQMTKTALDTAYSNFENAVEPELIDCYIYEVNAIQQRYKYLLKKVKEINQTEVLQQKV